ncbi:MAG: DegT/DnrJ/EryC1/StrS family aminotransferase [Vicinamibacterales bacterium]
MPNLAVLGGPKAITRIFEPYSSFGPEEVQAARDVVESGVLSRYLGAWHEDFYGGPKVREFEQRCAERFNVKHAITVNSWTSGLIAAVGAIGIEPGDEVIVSPWTMCASATAVVHWNGLPVFADIEPLTFCLDPASVESRITSRTKAILAVDIFGQSADMTALRTIADRHHLALISDTAQAPGAKYRDSWAGTLADIGGYSLNYHKHIHTGEGGVLVTNDDALAERLQLIRNHAEAVVGPKGVTDLTNMIGHNFRLGEIECAIGVEQLNKLERQVATRKRAADRLTKGLAGLAGLRTPVLRERCSHVYYIYPLILDPGVVGVDREVLYSALVAEGVQGLTAGYQNIHRLPMFQRKIAYGRSGFPWTASFSRQDIDYSKGICPVAERLHDETYLGLSICTLAFTDEDVDALIGAFQKVWSQVHVLQTFNSKAVGAS